MRCEAYQEAWLQARYAEHAPQPRVREHIETCVDCQRFTRGQKQLDRQLEHEQPIEPGLGFDTRFFARLEAERAQAKLPRSPWRRPALWLSWASLAAALALALLLFRPAREAQPSLDEDVALMRELELVEELPMLRKLDEVEAYEVLARIRSEDLDALAAEVSP